jgi:hypothetical protein
MASATLSTIDQTAWGSDRCKTVMPGDAEVSAKESLQLRVLCLSAVAIVLLIRAAHLAWGSVEIGRCASSPSVFRPLLPVLNQSKKPTRS